MADLNNLSSSKDVKSKNERDESCKKNSDKLYEIAQIQRLTKQSA
jgi:hypothetical protein